MSEKPRVFVTRVTSPELIALLGTAGVADAVLKRRRGRRLAQSLVGMSVLALYLATIRVVAGPRGLSVGFGPWGWPARNIGIERLRAVGVEEINPMKYGGWGYRVRPDATRIIVSRGPALVVELDNGQSFGVTMPDAGVAAKVLLSWLDDSSSRADR